MFIASFRLIQSFHTKIISSIMIDLYIFSNYEYILLYSTENLVAMTWTINKAWRHSPLSTRRFQLLTVWYPLLQQLKCCIWICQGSLEAQIPHPQPNHWKKHGNFILTLSVQSDLTTFHIFWGSGPEGVDDLCFRIGEISPPSPSPPPYAHSLKSQFRGPDSSLEAQISVSRP